MYQNPKLQEPVHHGSVLFPLEFYHCVFPLGPGGLPVHWHEEFEITLVRKGSCTYQIDLTPCLIKEGDFLLLPPGMLHGTGERPAADFITDSFVFRLDMLMSLIPDSCTTQFFSPISDGRILYPAYLAAESKAAQLLLQPFEQICRIFEEKSSGYELEIKAELFHLFFLLRSHVPFRRQPLKNTEITDKLKTVLQFIQEHYRQTVTVREMADLCHFSEYHFMRFFKRHMNMTCIEYLNQYRLETAAQQLAQTELPVTRIALETGFNNISYFNRIFRKKFGITPKEYRCRFSESQNRREIH